MNNLWLVSVLHVNSPKIENGTLKLYIDWKILDEIFSRKLRVEIFSVFYRNLQDIDIHFYVSKTRLALNFYFNSGLNIQQDVYKEDPVSKFLVDYYLN